MAFTMHSHSGQFCPGHAKDQLEVVIQHAISIGLKTIGLTEHMPRTDPRDLYPEEMDDPEASLAVLFPRHDAYLIEARRLQSKYASQIHILIGFEGEWIRPDYAATITSLASDPIIDYFIGSVHHVHNIPIDLDRDFYDHAITLSLESRINGEAMQQQQQLTNGEAKAAGEESLYCAYYDSQYEMLQALKPRVVGHFDLIRLLSVDPGRDVPSVWPTTVWKKMKRNLEFIVSYGGWLECNTSALRKGLAEPYPARFVAEEYLRRGGKFTFSDDSHGTAQLGTNFSRALSYLESLGVTEVWTLDRASYSGIETANKSALREKSVPLSAFKECFK